MRIRQVGDVKKRHLIAIVLLPISLVTAYAADHLPPSVRVTLVDRHRILIRGENFERSQQVVVSADVADPHASIACQTE